MTQDWVVVGAGSAGCVAAARLSEDPARRVTLLDAGPDLAAGDVPADIDGSNFFDALALPGRTFDDLVASRTTGAVPTPYRRGRGVGGSSTVNAMVALRGADERYKSWGWDDTDEAWARVALPAEVPDDDELGPVDRALLAADGRARPVRLTRSGRRRVTSAEVSLWPALGRANLTVRPDASVDRVVFDGRRAVGVALADGREFHADHVVMAAGAIHTPVILLRSGVDTPGLGCGLRDHPSAAFTLVLRPAVVQDTDGLAVGSLVQFDIDGDSIQLLPMNHLGRGVEVSGLGLLMVALMTPTSATGTITITPDGLPEIDFALLSDERDVVALTRGVRRALQVLGHRSFTDIVEQVLIDDVGTTTDALTDDASIGDWLRGHCADYVHATSSCAMGTVVDDSGGVIGYERLHVCDASVFPDIPDVNTHLPTTMSAERLLTRGRILP